VKLRVLALAMWCICISGFPCFAQDLPPDLDDFRISYWRGGDGIALGPVRAIVQDQDGYLWLAANVGLVRFDGLQFSATDLTSGTRQLPVAPCRAVYVAHDGSMWVGYGRGQGVYHIVHGEVREAYLQNQITGFINTITEDSNGTVWVGHDQGLHRFHGGMWESIRVSSTNDQRVFDVHEDRTHNLWVATATGLYRRTDASRFDVVSPGAGVVRAISEDSNGHIWVTDELGGFRRAGTSERNHLFDGSGMSLLHDREGNLWVAANAQGLWQVRGLSSGSTPTLRRATARTGMLSDEGTAFLEDRAGNIWVGADQGLNRLTPLRMSHVVDIGVVSSIAIGGDGTVWAGTASRLIAIAPSIANPPGKLRVIGSTPVRTVHAARDGTIWAATAEGLQSVVNGRLQPASIAGPPLTHITSIASDRRGAVWVVDGQQGLIRVAHGRMDRMAAATAGLSARPLFAHIDGAGRAWIAFEGGVVRSIDADGLVHQYGTADGLPHTTVYAIQDDELGHLWVGGNSGLSLFHGDRFQTLAMGQGPPEALAVTTDNLGNLWITDQFRILRFRRDDLVSAMSTASYRLQYGEYAEREGVAGQPRWLGVDNVARAPDGALWFVTARGLTIVDPMRLRNEVVAPLERPRIEGATADDRRVSADAGALLPPRTGRLRIDYALLSLSSLNPRTRFRYRLDGFDSDWVDGTTTRQAFYTNLSPGPYRFRLQATDHPDWDQGETTWSFSIQPMFYQTAWFFALSAVALVLIAVSAWQLRLHQVRRAFSAVFDERMRVSREIHDTLLQSFVGIALQLDSASRDLEDSSSGVREQLVRARQQIEECVTEARNSIWDLRSPALDKEGLIGALRTAGEQLTAGKLRFSLTVTGTPRQIPSNLEMQLVRIGHEAVMNTVRHSHAHRVQMEVGFDDRFVRLHVSDDGWGFDPDRQKPNGTATHYGLVMMRERAACAGGRCTIESSPGSGVQVFAEFPLLPQA